MIIHSPVISGSMTFASGSTFTLPDNGIYSGSFSGSFQGDGSSLVLGGGVVSGSSQLTESLDLRYVNLTESASLSMSGSLSGSFTGEIQNGTGTLTSITITSASAGDLEVTEKADLNKLVVDTNTLTANVASNMVGVGTATPSNPFSLGDQTLAVNSTVGNTTGILQLQNNGNGEITIYGYAGSAIIQPSGSMDLVLYADNGNKGLTLGASGTASMDMHLLPDANITYDLGSPTKRWRDIYLSGNTMNLGGNRITSDGNGLNFSDADGNPVGVTTGEVIVSGSGGTVSLGVDADGNLSQTNTSTGTSGSSAKINDTDGTLPYRSGSNFGDSLLSQNGSVLTIAGNLVPDNTSRTLGTSALPFQDLYLSSASLYIDGTQVLSSNTNELIITTDADQSLKLVESGADTITLQTQNGDITLTSSGTGNIELDAPIQIAAGNQILSSDGNAILFGEDINLQSNRIDAANLVGIVSGSQQVTDLLPTGVVSGSAQTIANLPAGTVSGSAQTIANLPAGTVSGSVQILGGTGILSSSTDNFTSFSSSVADSFAGLSTDYNDLQNIPSGILSSSTQNFTEFSSSVATTFSGLSTDYNDLQNIPAGIISSSAITYSGNDVTVLGNLTVQGDTTTLNTSTLIVEDKLITLASGSIDASAATGAGIEVDGAYGIGGANKARLRYDGVGWESNVNLTMSGSARITANKINVNTLEGIGSINVISSEFKLSQDALKIGNTAVTTTAAELNLLDTATAGTITNSKAVIYGAAGEVNATKLQVGGVDITSTPAELNLLDGVAGLVQADFTKLAAIDATAAEINKLDGATLSTTELNYVTGVTSAIQDQLDAITGTDIEVTLTGAVTGTGTITNLGDVSIATTATADPTLTIDGDASGTATFTNLGNATLTLTIADDSHNHTIANVDGLQSALDGKLANTHDFSITLTGDVSGTGTVTNMGNVSFSTTVADDSHNHTIANIDGLQDALDAKQGGLTPGTGVSISSGTISIGQAVATNSAVTFASVSATGDIVAYASSDERLKDDIKLIDNPIGKVKALRGVTWEWNDNADELQKSLPNVGVIAQDVEKVLPQLVKDRDNGFKGVDYDKIVGLLVEAIKDQQKQIDDLKSKLG